MLFIITTFVMTLASNASALPVRLRSEIAPTCTSGSGASLRYADLFASGNIAVQGSYGCKGVFIYDISNPDAPVLANHYNPVVSGSNRQFLEAIVVGNRGYFGAGNTAGVHIVDLTNPYAPVLLGVVNSTTGNGHNSIHEMVVFQQNGGTFLVENFNSLSTKTLKVINVTNPASPVFVRDIIPTDPQWVHAMVVKGNRMFTSGWGNSSNRGRTEIYDISNITTQAPVLLGFISDQTSITAGNSMHSAWPSEDGNWLYSCRETNNGSGDLRVYDITDPAAPLLVNSIGMVELGLNAVTPHNPVVHGNFLYIAWYQAGLQVFNISDRANPIRIGQYDTFPGAFAPPTREQQEAALDAEPWDMVCGTTARAAGLPTSYDGLWAVYPNLGNDKILVGDLARGMLILDTRLISSPTRINAAATDGRGINSSVFSPSTGEWQMADDSIMDQANFRRAGDIIVTGDYDGDEKADFAVFRPSTGVWYLQESTNGLVSIRFGKNGDVPVPADYDADGKTDVAVWRPSTGMWYIQQSIVGFRAQQWGMIGDKPLTGDYDGDGKADVAVWRSSTGIWAVLPSTAAIPVYQVFGQNGDRPVNADFDGNGVSDFAVYRPSNGAWYILDAQTRSFTSYRFGTSEDIPVTADYDGDGKMDIAVFRPSTNYRYSLNSSNGELSSGELRRIDTRTTQTSVSSR
ncbi:MAG: VCBS repeat-containing protein [Chloracidobacterium sp.]|nr:VCBS repeat-containing protein [Chloracidobacterium sp.]